MENITLKQFKWLNEPKTWKLNDDVVEVTTENKSDFWQETLYGFKLNTGHVFGVDIEENFTFSACVEADFNTLYDQAGLMIYLDEKHWIKTGIEYNDGQPMIGSVHTDGKSDWAIGLYHGDPKKFYIRLTRVDASVCIKYSTDNVTWHTLRLCTFPTTKPCFIGVMCCSPQREGLTVKFSDIKFSKPQKDILHSN